MSFYAGQSASGAPTTTAATTAANATATATTAAVRALAQEPFTSEDKGRGGGV
jgi:hypothetical protein